MNFVSGAACLALLWPVFAIAQAQAPVASPGTERSRVPEPNVQHSVIEDDANRVEELKVRGQTRSVIVTRKGAFGGTYEIDVGDPSREMSAGADTRRGTAGQRMWRVLTF